MKIYEYEEVSAKDGGIVFQAIVSHDMSWKIVDGKASFNQFKVDTKVHKIDVFPDLNYTEGYATSTYYVLNEAAILKNKLDLLTEELKKSLVSDYAKELTEQSGGNVMHVTDTMIDQLSNKYFDNTSFDVSIRSKDIVFRGVSSRLDSGRPKIVFKASTHMVDTLDGKQLNNWQNIVLTITGNGANLTLNEGSTPKVSQVQGYDRIQKRVENSLVETILPSLILEFKGDSIDTQGMSEDDSLKDILSKQMDRMMKTKGYSPDVMETKNKLNCDED
jgi:hypothetical protein